MVVGLLIVELPHLDEPRDLLGRFRAFLGGRVAVEHEDGTDAPLEEVDAEVENPNNVRYGVALGVVQNFVLRVANLVDVAEEQVAAVHHQLLPR